MDLRDDDDIEDRRGGVKIHDESNRVCTCACYRAAKPVENREICYLCIYVYHRSQGKELHSTIKYNNFCLHGFIFNLHPSAYNIAGYSTNNIH